MISGSVNLIPEASVDSMRDLAIRSEKLGFERCWVYDEGLATRDVYVTMTAILRATENLIVGPGITNPYTRHPGQTAAAIASLDEMSDGRAFLGIGAGGSLTLDPLGIQRYKPLETVRQTISACRQLFAGEKVDLEGPVFSFKSAQLDYGRSDIEIWLAGRGPKMLDLGGAFTDGVMLDFIFKPSLGEYVKQIRMGAEREGNDPKICYSTMIVTDDESLEIVRPHMTYRLVDSPAVVLEELGVSEKDISNIRGALADGLEAAAEYVSDDWVLPFVISGSVKECANELADLFEMHGFDEFMIPVFEPDSGISLLETTAQVLGG
ncbi:MAG: LLM class flavin-dependent oxidoreductase [Acidimicrobiales bacterium]|jgi:5,10-methylenetetrahydromethanopterin reductase|nr:LLM class flavin-dependent oxidoreductase [Acidimicrobiales bacterium]MDP6285627.1 LLM class flavin-dependent oxidoreductase [Acidimicrobiales bacterium]HJL91153.1 LLM class flavin-dependent oxidoreductase [Acidimicrobiales bacterium]HJO41402.1 LLM class flavin-dependent oxidoreductase [Acidimicrobiales bacterium]|tara:strand:+ start:8739 stop:9704 length:966 start_codon:yes stop_codon:yes gene_type:complete